MARYIDADALIKELLDYVEADLCALDTMDLDRMEQFVTECDVENTESIVDIIRAQETAAVIPVKHGKWIKHILKKAKIECGYNCSICGEWLVVGLDYIKRYKHCHNCGAKMDGEDDE